MKGVQHFRMLHHIDWSNLPSNWVYRKRAYRENVMTNLRKKKQKFIWKNFQKKYALHTLQWPCNAIIQRGLNQQAIRNMLSPKSVIIILLCAVHNNCGYFFFRSLSVCHSSDFRAEKRVLFSNQMTDVIKCIFIRSIDSINSWAK